MANTRSKPPLPRTLKSYGLDLRLTQLRNIIAFKAHLNLFITIIHSPELSNILTSKRFPSKKKKTQLRRTIFTKTRSKTKCASNQTDHCVVAVLPFQSRCFQFNERSIRMRLMTRARGDERSRLNIQSIIDRRFSLNNRSVASLKFLPHVRPDQSGCKCTNTSIIALRLRAQYAREDFCQYVQDEFNLCPCTPVH